MSRATLKKVTARPISRERMFDIVRRPVVTEKSTLAGELGKITFVVANDATKPEIKQAIEGLFEVKVKAVNTLVRKGKSKRFRGTMGRRTDTKFAIVTLVEGQSIDVTTGL